MDPRTQAWIDQDDAHITALIRQRGWAIEYIGGDTCRRPGCVCPPSDEPPFAYTIGFFGLAHPELLLVGLSHETALEALNELGARIRAGETLLPGRLITFDGWPHCVIPEEVPNPGEIVFGANRFYRRSDEYSVPVLQLTYDDAEGRFPWDEGYAEPARQPRPGTFQA